MDQRVRHWCLAMLVLGVTAISYGCIHLDSSSQRGTVRRYKAPRPVPFTQSWRGERPGYYIYTGFVRTSSRIPKARNSMCRLDVLLDGPPELPYEVLGLVSAEKIGPALVGLRGGEEQAVGWLKAKACRIGASAIYDVKTTSQWLSFRDRLVRSIGGTAVAAIYLQSRPSPQPPPLDVEGADDEDQGVPPSEGSQQGQQEQEQEPSETRDALIPAWLD